jgi:hypothetical protein
MKILIDQWHTIAFNIAVINEVRLQGSKRVSNFEHGMEKEETCFRGPGVCPYSVLSCDGNSTAETFKAGFSRRQSH